MTTYAGFITALSAMTPAGVRHVYGLGDTPPASLNTADLPAMWVQLPKGEHDVLTFQSGKHWPTYSAEVVVAVIPAAQGMSLGRAFEQTVELMDNLATAMDAVRPAESKPRWTMRQGSVNVAGIDYWAVIIEVTAAG